MKSDDPRVDLAGWIAARLAKDMRMPVEKIDRRASFARYGLDSLKAVKLVSDLEDYLDQRIDVTVVWDHPTIEDLARHLTREASPQVAGTPTGAPAMEGMASGIQHAILKLQKHFPGTYIVARAFRLQGALNLDALRGSLADLVQRHALLRTSFHETAEGFRWQEHASAELALSVEDRPNISEEELNRRLVELTTQPLDPGVAPLLRTQLIRKAPDEHVLAISASHPIFDAWSLFVLMHELNDLFAARERGARASLPPVDYRYSTFIDSERVLVKAEGASLEKFWRGQLEGRVNFVPLPTRQPRGEADALTVLARSVRLDPVLAQRVRKLASAQDCTVYQLMLSAWGLLLRSWTHEERIPITSSVDVRRPVSRQVVGPFLNHVLFAVDSSGDPSVSEVIARVRESTLAGLGHDSLPFDRIMNAGWADWRDRTRVPLLQVQCNYYDLKHGAEQSPHFRDAAASLSGASGAPFSMGSLRGTQIWIPERRAPFELALWITAMEEDLSCRLEYRASRIEDKTAEALLRQYVGVLEGIVADPSRKVSTLEKLPLS